MKTTGRQVLKKLQVVLAVLLCSLYVLALPISACAAPALATAQQEHIGAAEEPPFAYIAGELAPGHMKGLRQLDRPQLMPLLQFLLQAPFTKTNHAAPAPHSFPASKGDCGLHTILTKGP